MRMRRLLLSPLLLLLATTHVVAQGIPRIEALSSPVSVRLRGLSAVDENIAWASGREGAVLRTVDAGKTWSVLKVPGAEKLDFRDVEGFSPDEAVILSIGPGEDSRVYRTNDAGKTWILTLQNHDPKAFFDCFDFDGNEGRLLGDPVDGRFQLLGTKDGGKTWSTLEGPEAVEGEAAFAASGSCVRFVQRSELVESRSVDSRLIVIVSGGNAPRMHWRQETADQEPKWLASEIGAEPKASSAGYFAIAWGRLAPLAVGGDFQKENDSGVAIVLGQGVLHYGVDTGRTTPAHTTKSENDEIYVPERKVQRIEASTFPSPSIVVAPRGYRSGAACHQARPICIATGPSGSDAWGGKQWSMIEGAGYDSVDVAGDVFWFSGDGGRLGRLVLPAQ